SCPGRGGGAPGAWAKAGAAASRVTAMASLSFMKTSQNDDSIGTDGRADYGARLARTTTGPVSTALKIFGICPFFAALPPRETAQAGKCMRRESVSGSCGRAVDSFIGACSVRRTGIHFAGICDNIAPSSHDPHHRPYRARRERARRDLHPRLRSGRAERQQAL